MNYSDLHKKNKRSKVAIIVVSIIMVVALAVSAIAVCYFVFSNRAKFVFDDLHNLDVERLEDLDGVYFSQDELTYTGFEEDFSEAQNDTYSTFYLSTINLHQNGYGKAFEEPEIGEAYNFEIEANGKSYSAKNMTIVDYHGKGTVEGNVAFDSYQETEIVIYLLPYFYVQEVSPFLEVLWAPDAIGTLIKDPRPEGAVVGGYCLVITSLKALDYIHFVNIERVA